MKAQEAGFTIKEYEKAIDWINEVPFEAIKTAHEMMQNGASHEQIIAYAFAKIAVGVGSEVTKEHLQAIQTLAQEEEFYYQNIERGIKEFGKDVFLIAETKKYVPLREMMHVKYEIEKRNLQQLNTIDTTVSYTHLTLPTNREV